MPRLVSRSVLALLALLAVSRSPYALFRGRLWAEEGTVYFRHMVGSANPLGLFWVPRRAGYQNLFTNAATWSAARVPLRYAPLVTGWLSLGLLLIVVWVTLAWPSDLLPNAGARLAAATLLVVGTLARPEAWLNSVNAQVYLAILALLLLFVRVDDLRLRRFALSVALLLVAGLSGLYAVALTPLFLVCALRDHSRRRWVHAATIGAAGAIQTATIAYARLSGGFNEKRAAPTIGEAVRSIGGVHLGGFAVGPGAISRLADDVRAGSRPATLVLAGLALALTAFLAALLWSTPHRRVPVLLVAALVLTETLVLFGSLGTGADGRYAVAPIALLTLMLVHGAATSTNRGLARAALALGAVVLVVGLSQFWTAGATTLRCDHCPEWADQVRSWQAGEIDAIQIWPYDTVEPWVLRLPQSVQQATTAASRRQTGRRPDGRGLPLPWSAPVEGGPHRDHAARPPQHRPARDRRPA